MKKSTANIVIIFGVTGDLANRKLFPALNDLIKSKNLDILFRRDFRILKGEILNSARFGIWSFHHGDNDHFRGLPPGFW